MSPNWFAVGLTVTCSLFAVCQADTPGEGQGTYCAYQDETAGQPGPEEYYSSGKIQPDNKTMKCQPNEDFCYTFWEIDPSNKDKPNIVKQGCWLSAEPGPCLQSECKSTSNYNYNPQNNNTRFCCCQGDLCNINITNAWVPPATKTGTTMSAIVPDPNYKQRTIFLAIGLLVLLAVIIALLYLAFRLFLVRHPEPEECPALMEPPPPAPNFELDPLKMLSIIDRGRYGEVWQGMLGDMDVAVKVYQPQYKMYFINERDIYMLPFMEKDSLPRFYGANEQIDPEGASTFIIVLNYVPIGSLTNYLRENVLDWNTMSKMLYSVASGLAHLHTDIRKGEDYKPAIAHRDFNTRNILVRNDLTCCLCDFGFAMQIHGSRFRQGSEEYQEQTSLADVGTLRYMAPEVLEGAVNLRDCEASLKQIDMYALGLVLWEIASRCSDLYQGMPVPVYKLPFQEELGDHPRFEDIQICVAKNRKRPKFPDVWKDTNQAVRGLKETIDDCWDHDAEARLTSLCVEERVTDIKLLWETRLKGVTPTFNVMGRGQSGEHSVVRNPTSTTPLVATSGAAEPADSNGNLAPAGSTAMSDSVGSHRNYSRPDMSMSASTTETTLTTSPSESVEVMPPKANRNQAYAKANNRMMHEYQGQNPTVERNTHKRSDEELAVLGNVLVDKALAQAAGNAYGVNDASAVPTRTGNLTEDLIDQIADNLESSLVQNDLLGQQPRVAPPPPLNIPLQDPQNPLPVRRKKQNVPGNGASTQPPLYAPRSRPVASYRPENKKSKLKKTRDKAGKILLPLFGRKRNDSTGGSSEGESYPTENLRQPAAAPHLALLSQQTGHTRSHSDGASNVSKSNLEPRPPRQPCQTEVCMMNGMPVVRPTSLPLAGGSQPQPYNVDPVVPSHIQPVTAGANPTMRSQPRLPGHGQSASNIDISPSGLTDTLEWRRPNSLLMTGGSNGNSTDSSDSNHNVIGPRKPPLIGNSTLGGHAVPPRDLFQDSMSQSATEVDGGRSRRTSQPVRKSSISLQQFGSDEGRVNQYQAKDYRC